MIFLGFLKRLFLWIVWQCRPDSTSSQIPKVILVITLMGMCWDKSSTELRWISCMTAVSIILLLGLGVLMAPAIRNGHLK